MKNSSQSGNSHFQQWQQAAVENCHVCLCPQTKLHLSSPWMHPLCLVTLTNTCSELAALRFAECARKRSPRKGLCMTELSHRHEPSATLISAWSDHPCKKRDLQVRHHSIKNLLRALFEPKTLFHALCFALLLLSSWGGRMQCSQSLTHATQTPL